MRNTATAFHFVACLAAVQTMPASRMYAQRPIDTPRGSITTPSITRPVETTGAYQSAAGRFRSSVSLAVVNVPTTNQTGLQGVQVKWAPYPGAGRYRLLRSASAGGPWTSLYEGPDLTYTMNPAPHQVRLFTRVVALQQVGEKYVTLDTSVSNDVMSGGRFRTTGANGSPINGFYGLPNPRCASQTPLTAVIHWPPVPFAGAYVMRVVRIDTASQRRVELANPTVRDTLATFTHGNEGLYLYTVRVRFDFPDWTAHGDTLHQFAGETDNVVGKVDGGFFSCIPR